MKFGISTFITDEGIGAGPLAAAVEQRGFNSLCVTEHSHIPVSPKEPGPAGVQVPREYHRTLDPFVALASAAAVTRSLRLATGILLLPQRDVIYTAKEISSLDVVSKGRLDVGVGVGWNLAEMRSHGTTPATRGDKMNEQLAALKQIWTQDEAEFHGRFIDFDPIYSWPKPVQRPHPPIYIGGESRAALERLRTIGDGWLPQAATTPEKLREVRRWLADNNRTDVPVMIWGAGRDKATLAGYADAEVDEVSFLLPTRPESATLRDLDELTDLARSLS
jgi:probable F420-dependent oxidoreductase